MKVQILILRKIKFQLILEEFFISKKCMRNRILGSVPTCFRSRNFQKIPRWKTFFDWCSKAALLSQLIVTAVYYRKNNKK